MPTSGNRKEAVPQRFLHFHFSQLSAIGCDPRRHPQEYLRVAQDIHQWIGVRALRGDVPM